MSFYPILAVISILTLGSATMVQAEGTKLILNPPLSESFPLEQRPEGVRVKVPVLLNDHTILGTDAILKSIYVGAAPAPADDWSQASQFTTALDHAEKTGTTVVYGYQSDAKPISTPLDLPDGMLLGEVDGQVQVLSLVKASRAVDSGVMIGDQIRSFMGHLPVSSLQSFLISYLTSRQQSKTSEMSSYTMEVWRPSQSATVTLQIIAHASYYPSFH